jgi:threonine dehydrogenase-like Zn-dependent dehydrogenase
MSAEQYALIALILSAAVVVACAVWHDEDQSAKARKAAVVVIALGTIGVIATAACSYIFAG